MKILLITILFISSTFQSFAEDTLADRFCKTIAKHDFIQYSQGIKEWTSEKEIAYWQGVELEDGTVKVIYQKFTDTIVTPPDPDYTEYALEGGENPDYAEYTLEKGAEKLQDTVALGKKLHNLYLAMDEENFDKYGRLIGLMREILYIDSVHIPLAIKGLSYRAIYWHEIHAVGIREMNQEYGRMFK